MSASPCSGKEKKKEKKKKNAKKGKGVGGRDFWLFLFISRFRRKKHQRDLDAETNGPVAEVGLLGLGHGVVVDVDDLVEVARADLGHIVQLLEVERARRLKNKNKPKKERKKKGGEKEEERNVS